MSAIVLINGATSPTVRKATLNGREHLVATATLIVPGVLNGSQGRLLYPPDEIARNFDDWNGMPLVANHPERDGVNVSARNPDVINERGLGQVFNIGVSDGKLSGEAWFDIQAVRKFDYNLPANQRIMPRLTSGKPIELSTGLFTDNVPAAQGATHNGETYDFVARNYRPDHVAVLPDQKGACSVNDGCGINVNERKTLWEKLGEWLGISTQETQTTNSNREKPEMSKQDAIKYLVTNCDCWKGEEKTLAALSEDKLKKLAANAKVVLVVNKLKGKKLTANEGDEQVAEGVDIASLAEFLGVATDPASDPLGFVKELQAAIDSISAKIGGKAEAPAVAMEHEEEEEEPVAMADPEEKPKEEAVANRKKQSLSQWEASMPAAARQVWNAAKEIETQERKRLVQQIVANGSYSTDQERAADTAELMQESLPALRKAIKRQGHRVSESQAFAPSFIGANGGPATLTDNEQGDVLDIESARQSYDPKYRKAN